MKRVSTRGGRGGGGRGKGFDNNFASSADNILADLLLIRNTDHNTENINAALNPLSREKEIWIICNYYKK